MVSRLACLIFLLYCCAPLSAAGQTFDVDRTDSPNVVVILIDDMGYGDLSIYGNGRIETPNIDRLAREGTRFTQFYASAPICSPSRVALTTGTYPQRWHIDSFLASRSRNARREMADYLDPRAPSIARAFNEAGYATAHFGKWHMGGGRDVGDAPLPRAYGFDESLVSFEGLGDRYLWPMDLAMRSAELGGGRVEWTEKQEMTRIYVDRALEFIRRHRDAPFYVNLWPNDVHDPFVPSPRSDLLEQYSEVARSDQEQRFFAVLDEMDRQIGRFLEGLREMGLEEETIVILTSDNGPTDWPRYYRSGVDPPGSTGPFRGRKWSLYEGGIRMPFIVRWPGRVPVGGVDRQTVFAGIDVFPTLATLADVSLPANLDGEDVSRALLGRPVDRTKPLFWQYPNDLEPGRSEFLTPELAIREGRWKLLASPDGNGVELYDLDEDPSEEANLADQRPGIAERLQRTLSSWWSALETEREAHTETGREIREIPLLDMDWSEPAGAIAAWVGTDMRPDGVEVRIRLPDASSADRIPVGRLPDAPFAVDMTFGGGEGRYHIYCVPLTEPVDPMLRRHQAYLMNFRPGANAQVGEEGHVMCQERSMRGILPDDVESRWHVLESGGVAVDFLVPWHTLRLDAIGRSSGTHSVDSLPFSMTIRQEKHDAVFWQPPGGSLEGSGAPIPTILVSTTLVRQPDPLTAALPARERGTPPVFVLESDAGETVAEQRSVLRGDAFVALLEADGLADGTYVARIGEAAGVGGRLADSPSAQPAASRTLQLAGEAAGGLFDERQRLERRLASLEDDRDAGYAGRKGHLQRARLMLTLSEIPDRAAPEALERSRVLLQDADAVLAELESGRRPPDSLGAYDHPAGFSADGVRGTVRFEPSFERRGDITVSASDTVGWRVSPYIYGTFSEPVIFDRPIYHHLYAQQLRNPSFEWGHPPVEATVDRFVGTEELDSASAQAVLEGEWFPRAEGDLNDLAAPWIGVGRDVRFELVPDAANTESAQRIVRQDREPQVAGTGDDGTARAGVAQIVSLPTWRTGRYTLRGFVRSDGSLRSAHARLYHDGSVVAEESINPIDTTWSEFEAALIAPRTESPRNTYVLSIEFGQSGTLDLDLVTLYPDDAVGGFDPQAVEQTRALRTGWIRWPGGNYASAYRWTDGIGPLTARPSIPNPAWRGLHSNFVGTDEFLDLTERTESEPLICVNAGNGTPQEAAAWVEYANGDTTTVMGRLRARNGHAEPYDVRFWNIGNELWGFWQVGHCDPDENARRYQSFAAAMRDVDATIRLIASGVGAHSIGDPVSWNRPLLEEVGMDLDIIDVHSYVTVPAWADVDDRRRALMLSAVPLSYETWLMSFRRDLVRRGLEHVQIDVGEYNGRANADSDVAERQGRLLYYAGFLHAFYRQGDYVMGANATEYSAFDPRGLPFDRMHPRYDLHRLYAAHAGTEPLRTHVSTPVRQQPENIGRDVVPIFNLPLVDAVSLRDSSDGTVSVSVINRDDEPMPVRLEVQDLRASSADWLLLDAEGVRRSTVDTSSGHARELDRSELHLTLPPLSVSLVQFKAATGPR